MYASTENFPLGSDLSQHTIDTSEKLIASQCRTNIHTDSSTK